jgi:murein DD-endopeptidase MepM/ murein hydrolase activator NlpD
MSPGSSRFNVLVVRADGRQMRRLSVPRWATRAAGTVFVIGLLMNVGLIADYTRVRRDHGTVLATRDQLEERAKAIEPMERRLAELRTEIIAWDALHAAIMKPLGAEKQVGVGIGGPALTAPGGNPVDQVDALLAHVREESRRLRALARVAKETGSVLAALPGRLPLRSALNSGFGPRLSPWTGTAEFHAGVDLAASPGTPVKATAPGTVRVAGSAAGYGTMVVVEHGHGIESRYGHLQSVSVAKGQQVERGQLLGLSGNTGRSTAPHLHYEVLVDGRPIDPRTVARE